MVEQKEDETDQGGKEGTVGRNQEAKEENLTETRLGFRSDRAAKTNRRAFCGRFVAMATTLA